MEESLRGFARIDRGDFGNLHLRSERKLTALTEALEPQVSGMMDPEMFRLVCRTTGDETDGKANILISDTNALLRRWRAQ